MLCDFQSSHQDWWSSGKSFSFIFFLLAMMDYFFSSKQQDNNGKNLWCSGSSGNWAGVSCSFWNNLGIMQSELHPDLIKGGFR